MSENKKIDKNILYECFINSEQEVEETEITTNDKNEEIKVIKKVKKNVPKRFVIKRPTRTLRDSSELFYGARYAEAVKAGLMPEVVLNKKVKDDGGLFTEEERNKYGELYIKLMEKEQGLQLLSITPEIERTEEQKSDYKIKIKEIKELREELRGFTAAQSALTNNTADTYARNKTIIWYFLNLAHQEINNELKPLFAGKTYDEKLTSYDNLVEDFNNPNVVVSQACERLLSFVTIWYFGIATDQESFEKFSANTIETS